jgi:predicted TIM-barrel fold metal-dependent hydrolase
MDTERIAAHLIEAMGGLEIIDCHEHIGPERWRTDGEVDVFTLFTSYTPRDLWLAGMSKERHRSLFDRSVPLDERWRTFRPFWERIRHGSYARAALLGAKRFYGVDDISDDTYAALSEAMQAANTPGVYERVLRNGCGIRTVLTECGTTQTGTPLLTPRVGMPYEFHPEMEYAYPVLRTSEEAVRPAFAAGEEIDSLDGYIGAFGRFLDRSKSEGAVGVKMAVAPYAEPDRQAAEEAFDGLLSGHDREAPVHDLLRDYVVDRLIPLAAERGLVVAVHTGYWGDFRNLHPLHMVPVLRRHRDVPFDIYHLGYPWPREALMLAKEFANVRLNLCWVHAISPRAAEQAVDEALDLLPVNKVLAFGGDYSVGIEKVYGQLTMARENIARPLARRIAEGRLDQEAALQIARRWFFDNPVELYGLQV